MTRRIIKAKSPVGVGAGQTAVLELGDVDIFHEILFTYTTSTAGGATRANMETELTQFRIIVNGVVQRTFTAKELFDIMEVYGIPFSAGLVAIYFSEPWRRTLIGEDRLAWPMGDLGQGGSFNIEIDIANNAAQVATLKAVVVKDFGDAPMGPIVKWKRHRVPVGSIGEIQWAEFGRDDPIYALHCFSADVNSLRIETDGIIRFDMTKAEADKIYGDNGLAPNPAMFHAIFDYTGREVDALSLLDPRKSQPFREVVAKFDMSAAVDFDMIVWQVGPRD